jgi:hypothetical protein
VKIKRIHTKSKDPVEKLYTIEEITQDDIPDPDKHLRKVILEINSLRFLNMLTLDKFTKQVRAHFVSTKVK